MSPLRVLAPDQRAVLELLLRQGRTYAELSELLGMPEDAVRTRAHGALAQLAPDRPAPVGEDGAVADWILGQLDDDEADGTSQAVARTPAWRAWAEDVAGQLADVDGATVPDVPAAEGEKPEPAPARKSEPKARPRPVRDAAATNARPRPVRDAAPAEPAAAAAGSGGGGLPLRSSRLGGALLIGALAVIIALVLVLVVFRGDDEEQPTAGANATPTASATPEVVREIVLQGVDNQAQGLMRVFRQPDGSNLVFALAADKMPANRRQEVYAVWFTKKGGAPRNLGFAQAPVGKQGQFATGGPQQGQEKDFAKWLVDYDTVVVARATADTASEKRPGQIVLRGRLPGGD